MGNHINLVRRLTAKFVERASTIYGNKFHVMNTHNLKHVADDVENMNCQSTSIDAFKFESYLGKIKNMLRSPQKNFSPILSKIT